MEQKRPADIFAESLDYLWDGLGLEEKGWKRLKKGDFKKRTNNGLSYLIWFKQSRTDKECQYDTHRAEKLDLAGISQAVQRTQLLVAVHPRHELWWRW